MFDMYTVDMDSFGADCPRNWEEIAEFLNDLTRRELVAAGEDPDRGYDPTPEGRDIAESIWERFCSGELAECPEPIWE